MKFIDIINGVLKGKIAIDQNGHDPFYGWGEKRLKEELRERLPHISEKMREYEPGPHSLLLK